MIWDTFQNFKIFAVQNRAEVRGVRAARYLILSCVLW